MVSAALSGVLGTITTLFSLFGDLGESLGFISGFGLTGFIVAAIALVVVLFFLFKFVLKSMKMVIVLFIIGIILFALLFMQL